MRRVTAEITWIYRLLTDMYLAPPLPVQVHSDNQSTFHIVRNPIFHESTKLVELDCHFVRHQFLSGLISLTFVPFANQLANLFTKPLSGVSHRSALDKLGVISFPSNLRRDIGAQIDQRRNEEDRTKEQTTANEKEEER